MVTPYQILEGETPGEPHFLHQRPANSLQRPPAIPAERLVFAFLEQFDYDFLAERQRLLRACIGEITRSGC